MSKLERLAHCVALDFDIRSSVLFRISVFGFLRGFRPESFQLCGRSAFTSWVAIHHEVTIINVSS